MFDLYTPWQTEEQTEVVRKDRRVQEMEKTDVTSRLVVDIILLCLSPILSLVFRVTISPFKRGFFCNDQSISHPYRPDTIPLWVVIVIGISVPCILMLLIEAWRYYYQSRRPGVQFPNHFTVFKRAVHPYIVAIYKVLGAFLFAVAVCQVSTDVIKYNIGRLRPHFLDVCKPNWTEFSCTDQNNNFIYVEADVCTGTEHVREARLSHPSGHSSMCMLCAVYFALYLQSRFTWRGSRLLKHFIQAAVLYSAIYVCVSRVSDYKHHWSDVLVGAILGTVVALLVAFYVSDLFVRPRLWDIAKKIDDLQMYKTDSKRREGYGATDAPSNELQQVPQDRAHQSMDLTRKTASHKPAEQGASQDGHLPTIS